MSCKSFESFLARPNRRREGTDKGDFEMNEIEQLYKNAGVEDKNINNQLYKDLNYPQFNAKKQLELIKLLAQIEDVLITYYSCDKEYNIRYCVAGWYDGSVSGIKDITSNTVEEALAGLVNSLWQSLTEEERKQIRNVLK